MKKIIIFCGVLLLAGCDCSEKLDKEAFARIFEVCMKSDDASVQQCRYAAREGSVEKVCNKR